MVDKITGKRDGSSLNQAPIQLPVVDHRGWKAGADAILRTKKPKLRRRFFQQQINQILQRAIRFHNTNPSVPGDLIVGARRPDRKKS